MHVIQWVMFASSQISLQAGYEHRGGRNFRIRDIGRGLRVTIRRIFASCTKKQFVYTANCYLIAATNVLHATTEVALIILAHIKRGERDSLK